MILQAGDAHRRAVVADAGVLATKQVVCMTRLLLAVLIHSMSECVQEPVQAPAIYWLTLPAVNIWRIDMVSPPTRAVSTRQHALRTDTPLYVLDRHSSTSA